MPINHQLKNSTSPVEASSLLAIYGGLSSIRFALYECSSPTRPRIRNISSCYRSPEPVLTPESAEELRGTIANVVFPTGIDRREDLGTPDRFDV